jgi:phenylpyruvate tautomerase PptA (4-oxalocrotonate tautomerase family)
MFDGRDLDDAERLVDNWQAGFEQRAAQARALAARLGSLTATARSEDELITVTVGASGAVSGLSLEEGIRDRPAAHTAREILATLRAAQTSLIKAVTEATAETVGADSETGRAVIASYAVRAGSADE